MAKLAKFLSSANGSPNVRTDVDDVFSNYVYPGTGSGLHVQNGVNLQDDGGMIWWKSRTSAANHAMMDTERGNDKTLFPNLDLDQETPAVISFKTDGFQFVSGNYANTNALGTDYCSWTFRKCPKFFDCFEYTGNSSGSQTISHNLGVAPAFVIIKRTDSDGDWGVYSAFGGSTFGDCSLKLNEPESELASIAFTSTPTSITVFSSSFKIDANIENATYVAYLFANNNGDGEFGPSGDQDIIKVGDYSGLATVNLGFEPQWLLVKKASGTGNWHIYDTMRGLTADAYGTIDKALYPNLPNDEEDYDYFKIQSNGFKAISATVGSGKYVYIAIRKGPLATPTSSSKVFAVNTWAGSNVVPNFVSGFPVDMSIQRTRAVAVDTVSSSRLTQGAFVQTNTTAKESDNSNYSYDYQDGYYGANTNGNMISWMWRRAPGYFDIVPYTAGSQAVLTLDHNLGVIPEMMWAKRRRNNVGGGTSNWMVYHKDFDYTYSYAYLNSDAAMDNTQTNTWPSAPTATQLTIGSWTGDFIGPGDIGSIFLFSSLPGVSKIGSYTGNGTSQTIDCGFSNGAKFVLIKQYDNTTAARWSVFDSYRGIAAGNNDPQLFLDHTDAEDTGHDLIDTTSSGFIVNEDNTAFAYQEVNQLNGNYIFYAIAAP